MKNRETGHAVIDIDSPIEIRNGRQVFSELTDQGYALADKIELWLQARPATPFTPSRVAQGVKCAAYDAKSILAWLEDRQMVVVGAGRGARRKYTLR
jgi:hypothetical protein